MGKIGGLPEQSTLSHIVNHSWNLLMFNNEIYELQLSLAMKSHPGFVQVLFETNPDTHSGRGNVLTVNQKGGGYLNQAPSNALAQLRLLFGFSLASFLHSPSSSFSPWCFSQGAHDGILCTCGKVGEE